MNNKSSVVVAYFLPGRAKDLSAPLISTRQIFVFLYQVLDNISVLHQTNPKLD